MTAHTDGVNGLNKNSPSLLAASQLLPLLASTGTLNLVHRHLLNSFCVGCAGLWCGAAARRVMRRAGV